MAFSKSNFDATGSGTAPRLGSKATVRNPTKPGGNEKGKGTAGPVARVNGKTPRPGFHEGKGGAPVGKRGPARPGFHEGVSK